MASSATYHLLGQSPTDPDTEPEEDESAPTQQASEMGQRLGTLRAIYVVAVCTIGSFLFAYVCESLLTAL
jgi:hypothetical protein